MKPEMVLICVQAFYLCSLRYKLYRLEVRMDRYLLEHPVNECEEG